MHGHPLEREVERRRADDRLRVARRLAAAHLDVVAVEGDVELAELELDAGALGDQPAEPLRERDAAAVDADERDLVEVVVPLDDLVRDAGERPVDRLGVEQDLPGRHARLAQGAGRVGALRACKRHSNSFPASLDRLKGSAVGHSSAATGRRTCGNARDGFVTFSSRARHGGSHRTMSVRAACPSA